MRARRLRLRPARTRPDLSGDYTVSAAALERNRERPVKAADSPRRIIWSAPIPARATATKTARSGPLVGHDPPFLEHQLQLAQVIDVVQGVGTDHNQVGELADFDRTQIGFHTAH